MKRHLSVIGFKDKIDTYKNHQGFYSLNHLSKINLFIGANNSGKSRFLRELFSNEEYAYFSYNLKDLQEIVDEINSFKTKVSDFYSTNRIEEVRGINISYDDVTIDTIHTEIKNINDQLKIIEKSSIRQYVSKRKIFPTDRHGIKDFLITNAKPILDEIEKLLDKSSFEKHYIPILRGLRPIGEKEGNFYPYTNRTVNDYFSEYKVGDTGISEKTSEFNNRIITGLNFYEDCKKMLLGTTSERKKVRSFEGFLSKNFFNGKEINIIPRVEKDGSDTNIVYLLIDNEERPIHEFGDGIQSIITLTYHMFFNKDKAICYFIEEPDLYLHPGYQRVFLNLLSSDTFKNHQFFITTHSNHFLDYTIDTGNISIYTFKKESKDDYIIENVSSGDMSTLELLGVRNSSVFLSNCTIWVEGITDRLYIRRFLELYKEKQIKDKEPIFLEDVHFSFLEYGGGNITHWSFLDDKDSNHPNIDVNRLCGKLFLVTDNDGAGFNEDGSEPKKITAKRSRHIKLENKLGKRYYCLKSREIENSLPEDTLKEVIKSYNSNESDINLDKITYSKYKHTKLGKFIDDNIEGLSKSFATDSGTVKDKVNFCKKAIKNLNDYNALTDDAKDLTAKIIQFIKENN